jgi:hypothetical protein
MTIVPCFLPRCRSDFELQMMPVIESMSSAMFSFGDEAGRDKKIRSPKHVER